MIICSKPEGNGTTREFLFDDTNAGDAVHVKTHLSGAVDEEWHEAGVIIRGGNGLEASVVRSSVPGQFVKLERIFKNEIAALQAIAVSYHAN